MTVYPKLRKASWPYGHTFNMNFEISPLSCADPDKSVRGERGSDNFLGTNKFHHDRTDLPREAIGPKGSVPVYLRKPIATCYLPVGRSGPLLFTDAIPGS